MTEKDPNGVDQHEAGAKLDAGKPDASLLLDFGLALKAVAEVATFGAKKYSRGGWLKVANGRDRYTAALMRHMLSESTGMTDPDSGLAHDFHAAWNALARLELRLREQAEIATAGDRETVDILRGSSPYCRVVGGDHG